MANLLLTKGYVAVVDDADFPLVSQWKWKARRSSRPNSPSYAARWEKNKCILLHRFLLRLKADDRRQVDHINHDGLDNRRVNLRVATHSQNLANGRRKPGQTGFRGVTRQPRNTLRPFVAQISINARNKNLGAFLSAEEAARAYDAAALLNFGEFARLNFPDDLRPTGQEQATS